MNKWKEIEEILENSSWSLDSDPRNELIQKISVYHEELVFQNEELQRVNERLEQVKDDYLELFEFAPVSYFIINKMGEILNANSEAKGIFGNIIGKNVLNYVSDKDQAKLYHFLKELVDKKKYRMDIDFLVSNVPIHMEVLGKQLYSQEKNFLIACIDFEKQYQKLMRYNQLSFKDQLTGLHNRRYFEKQIYAIKPDDLPYSLVVVDVNGLKVLNDAFGHRLGDELLKKTSKIITDFSVKNSVVARLGGDEFVVSLPNTTFDECRERMEIFHSSCSNIKVNDIVFSISCGHATVNSITDDVDMVFEQAESKMYENKIANEFIKSSETVQSIFDLLCEKYPLEKSHSIRVSKYMRQFATHLGFDENNIETMSLAGLMHNIEKVANTIGMSDDSYTASSGKYQETKRRPEIAYRILKSSSKFSKIAHIILYQHERFDGTGYPKGLKGEEIPLESRMITICEAFESMTSEQSFRDAMSEEDALAELDSGAGKEFDGNLVKSFVTMIREKSK